MRRVGVGHPDGGGHQVLKVKRVGVPPVLPLQNGVGAVRLLGELDQPLALAGAHGHQPAERAALQASGAQHREQDGKRHARLEPTQFNRGARCAARRAFGQRPHARPHVVERARLAVPSGLHEEGAKGRPLLRAHLLPAARHAPAELEPGERQDEAHLGAGDGAKAGAQVPLARSLPSAERAHRGLEPLQHLDATVGRRGGEDERAELVDGLPLLIAVEKELEQPVVIVVGVRALRRAVDEPLEHVDAAVGRRKRHEAAVVAQREVERKVLWRSASAQHLEKGGANRAQRRVREQQVQRGRGQVVGGAGLDLHAVLVRLPRVVGLRGGKGVAHARRHECAREKGLHLPRGVEQVRLGKEDAPRRRPDALHRGGVALARRLGRGAEREPGDGAQALVLGRAEGEEHGRAQRPAGERHEDPVAPTRLGRQAEEHERQRVGVEVGEAERHRYRRACAMVANASTTVRAPQVDYARAHRWRCTNGPL